MVEVTLRLDEELAERARRFAEQLLRLTLSDPICLALNGCASVSAHANTGGGNRPCSEVLLARGLNAA
jgi:hypothetical protein